MSTNRGEGGGIGRRMRAEQVSIGVKGWLLSCFAVPLEERIFKKKKRM
jgi:hypothetical protein